MIITDLFMIMQQQIDVTIRLDITYQLPKNFVPVSDLCGFEISMKEGSQIILHK